LFLQNNIFLQVCSNPPDERWSEIEDYRFDLFESPDVRPILEAFGLRVASTPLADDRHHKLDFPSIRFSERTLHPDPNVRKKLEFNEKLSGRLGATCRHPALLQARYDRPCENSLLLPRGDHSVRFCFPKTTHPFQSFCG